MPMLLQPFLEILLWNVFASQLRNQYSLFSSFIFYLWFKISHFTKHKMRCKNIIATAFKCRVYWQHSWCGWMSSWQMESRRWSLYLEEFKEQMVFVCAFEQRWKDAYSFYLKWYPERYERTENCLENTMVSKQWGQISFMCYKRKEHIFFPFKKL